MTSSLPTREILMKSTDQGWTLADWELLPDDGRRYEIVEGVLYMSTAPSPRHQRISLQIVLSLVEQIDRRGVGLTFYAPIGVIMPGADPVQPDIVVVRTEDLEIVTEQRIVGVPSLIVEILSPSNAEYDLVTKRALYARAGVPEYWVVRPREDDILVHTRPEPTRGHYLQLQHIASDAVLASPTLPFRAPIGPFFADLPRQRR